MAKNQFFKKQGPFSLKELINLVSPSNDLNNIDDKKIFGVENLLEATDKDITFLNSSKYKDISINTKAIACLTTSNLEKFLPKSCVKINVKNILLAITQVSKKFYPNADLDNKDENLVYAETIKNKFPEAKFGKNVLIGLNVKIGKKTVIGNNTIIESNVQIGEKCLIGSNVSIRNSLISDEVYIQDGCVVGCKGFGFIPNPKKNIRSPHIGNVILKNGVELGSNCTIDRGSLSDTIIDSNTFLDNQVHVAHNVKIGKNCIIAGQCGIAGSTVVGDNVVMGGQAGLSGHLKIGNNVKIGGGSGVINDVLDNIQVMGYPAVPIKDFIKRKILNEK
tara:strand:- start:368 stop:1369 length:1002 start_codon:yes stop_codon:yes gene_type:complete